MIDAEISDEVKAAVAALRAAIEKAHDAGLMIALRKDVVLRDQREMPVFLVSVARPL